MQRREEGGTKNEISNIHPSTLSGIQPVFATLSPMRRDAQKRQKKTEKATAFAKKSSLGYPTSRFSIVRRVYTRYIKSRAFSLSHGIFDELGVENLFGEKKTSVKKYNVYIFTIS